MSCNFFLEDDPPAPEVNASELQMQRDLPDAFAEAVAGCPAEMAAGD
jgi:hypothetical protein